MAPRAAAAALDVSTSVNLCSNSDLSAVIYLPPFGQDRPFADGRRPSLADPARGLTPVNVQRMYAESQVKQHNHLQSICIFLPVAHSTTSSSRQRTAPCARARHATGPGCRPEASLAGRHSLRPHSQLSRAIRRHEQRAGSGRTSYIKTLLNHCCITAPEQLQFWHEQAPGRPDRREG